MTAPETTPPAEAAPKPAPPKPGRKFRVEALATGPEGAVKLMILTTVEPDNTKQEDYKSRASAQYRVEFDAWAEGLKVTVTAQ